MSKNDALEHAILDWGAGAGALPVVDAWELRLYKHDPDANNETGAADEADYDGYEAIELDGPTDLTVSESRLYLNETQTFGQNGGAEQFIERAALALSVDGGVTFPYLVYGDSDLNQSVPTNGSPQVVQDTGFGWSED